MIKKLILSSIIFICLNLAIVFYNLHKIFGDQILKVDLITFFQTNPISYFLPFNYVLLSLLIVFILFISFNKFNKATNYYKIIFIFFLLILCVGTIKLFVNYNVFYYISHKAQYSDFYENNFVDAKQISIKAPEQKKNLILIFMESMEFTFANKSFFGNNLIPELDDLAKNNISFTKYINGYGQNNTQMALIATLTGIPCTNISLGKENTNYVTQQLKTFLPKLYALSDILKDNNYQNIFIQGSSLEFAGANVFLKTHHFDSILNSVNFIENYGKVKFSETWWGVADEDTFDYFKMNILKLDKNKPFLATMFTIDTHCGNPEIPNIPKVFNNNRYDIIRNSSLLIQKFIDWLKEQPFAKDTVVVIVGDHLRMSDLAVEGTVGDIFSSNKKIDNRYVYNCFINSVYKNEKINKDRTFSQIDLFPTILEALGFKIEGSRLGLGTSLFSDRKTLLEELGEEKLMSQLAKSNKLYKNLWKNK